MPIFGNASGGAFIGFKPGGTYSTKGDELYFQSLLQADDKMAKIDAAAKPNLDAYDKDLEKLKALPGEKAFLHAQYKNVLGNLQQGANKSGGWLRYAQTDEFKENINKLNNWTYNTALAEQNYAAYEHLMKTAKPNDMDALYLDESGNPRATFEGKKPRFLTNKEYLNQVASLVDLDEVGGRLNALPISLNLGDKGNFVEDLSKIAANLGHDKWETPFQVVEGLIKTSKGAQEYLQAGTKTGTSNERQIQAAARAIKDNLSSEGWNGARRDWINSGSKLPFEKYIVNEAYSILSSRRVSESANNTTISKLGGDGNGSKDGNDMGYIAALVSGDPSTTDYRNVQDIKTPGVDSKGNLTANALYKVYPQTPNFKKLGELLPKGTLVNRPVLFDGVVHDKVGAISGEKNRALLAGNWKYGEVKGVEMRWAKPNPLTGAYDMPADNEELSKVGLVNVNPNTAMEQRVDTKGYKAIPFVSVDMETTYGDIRDSGGNIYGLYQNEKGEVNQEPLLDMGIWANNWPVGGVFSDNIYASNRGVESIEKRKNLSVQSDYESETIGSRDATHVKVKITGLVPLNEGDMWDDGAVAHKYPWMHGTAVSAQESNARLHEQQNLDYLKNKYK